MTRRMAGLLFDAPDTGSGSGESVRDAFLQAFTDAVASHTPQADATGETDDDAEGGEGDDEEGDEAEQPARRETAETGKGKTAAGDGKADNKELLTDDEFAKLQATHKDDPVALRKSLEGAFTKKTQALAAERQTYEKVKGYVPFIEAYEADPLATLQRLAEQNGLTLSDGKAKPAGDKTDDTAAADTEATVDALVADFKKDLGPDLDYLSDALAPAIKKLAERIVASTVDQRVKPLREQAQAINDRFANEQTDAIMVAFEAKHPDWKEHEEAMSALMATMQPNGLDEGEYLDRIYKLATRDKWEADREANIEREVNGRFKKRVAKMNAGETETRTDGTPDSEVRKRPAGPVDFAKAAKDAMAGIRYDDDD